MDYKKLLQNLIIEASDDPTEQDNPLWQQDAAKLSELTNKHYGSGAKKPRTNKRGKSKPQKAEAGERVTLNNMRIVNIEVKDGSYGFFSVTKFLDPSDNVYIWRASGHYRNENRLNWVRVGNVANIKATINPPSEQKSDDYTYIKHVDLIDLLTISDRPQQAQKKLLLIMKDIYDNMGDYNKHDFYLDDNVVKAPCGFEGKKIIIDLPQGKYDPCRHIEVLVGEKVPGQAPIKRHPSNRGKADYWCWYKVANRQIIRTTDTRRSEQKQLDADEIAFNNYKGESDSYAIGSSEMVDSIEFEEIAKLAMSINEDVY